MRLIRIGTRGSALAFWQSRHVSAMLSAVSPGVRVELVEIRSAGDDDSVVPLWQLEGTGFFTSTLERALAAGDVDVAVHSYKDLPLEGTTGLIVAAVPARGPVEDVLCARDGRTLRTLPTGARVGTCSSRRTAQVKAARPDIQIVSLRGNVPARIERVTAGELDAVVLARAGIVRLGLEDHVSEVFDAQAFLPAPGQGAIAVQCRAGDQALVELLASIADDATRRSVATERALLHALGGGCSVPVGALARAVSDHIVLDAAVLGMDPPRAVRVADAGRDPDVLGRTAAQKLIDAGAGRILAELDKLAGPGVETKER
jgi:hydroxymethylbilane synthase